MEKFRRAHPGIAAAESDELAPVPSRDVSQYAQTMHVGREHGNDHGLRRTGHYFIERPRHGLFAAGRPVGVDVGRVAQEQHRQFVARRQAVISATDDGDAQEAKQKGTTHG